MAASPPPPSYQAAPPAEVDILLLGSPGIGKSTFLARLPHLRPDTRVTSATPPPKPVDLAARPFSFSVTLFRKPYTFNIWPNTGTLFLDPFPTTPRFVIIAYDITSRASLHNAQYYWRKQFSFHYDHLEHTTPVMLLGFKRDLRTEERGEDGELVCVMPQEGVRVAGEMRCDRYAECSAMTGELLWEAVEDITRMAAMTTTERGGLSEGTGCSVM